MALTLRLYTDFVCPFCFIAEQSTVPRLLDDFEMQLDWHGFELHPETPEGGMPLSDLFPGVNLSALHAQTKQFAAGFGVRDFNPPDRLRNTRRALAMAEYARDQDKLTPFRNAAFEAHWRLGKNLELPDDLVGLAESAGLDPTAALEASTDPAYLARVDQHQAEARARGVRGIPTFELGSVRVTGCQPYEALASAARRAGAVPKN